MSMVSISFASVCNSVDPPKCLIYVNATDTCHAIDCWTYNHIKGQCEQVGKEWLPGMILQGVPLTGVFGAGFANIGRWDIFVTFILVFACPIILYCLFVCCVIARDINMESENATLSSGCQSCFSCCYSIALLGMYVYGLVVFANREVEGPWKDYQGNTIMCPLI